MRSSFSAHGPLMKTPSYRQQAARRRMMAVCAILGLALASGLIGSLTGPRGQLAARAAATGPFSYFPHS